MRKAGLGVVQQRGFTVTYDYVVAGQYFVDLMVEGVLLVELNTASEAFGVQFRQVGI